MQITQLKEFEGSFWFSIKAENLQEAALITRAGMNGTQKIELMAALLSRARNFKRLYERGEL